ncbi:MAG: hypothetical protein N2204_02950 [Anaerolineae bacterium]|nr:hypothetical protein [Anaerolineae bacterium]
MSITELWQASSQIFPILQQVVAELNIAPAPQLTSLVRQRFVRALRRHGLDVQPIEGLDAAWLLNDKVCVHLVPADADLTARAAALRAAMRQNGSARGGYLIQLGPKPRWRWTQTSAGSPADQARPGPLCSTRCLGDDQLTAALEQEGGQDGS